jgi:hypothetical protein
MKKILFILTGFLMLFATSCVSDLDNNIPGTDPVKENILRLSVSTEQVGMGGFGLKSVMATRTTVAAEPGEDEISSLYLLFFDASASRNGAFVDYVEIGGSLSANTSLNINLIGTNIDVTGAYNILAIANIHGTAGARYLNGMTIENWMGQWIGKTEQAVMSEAIAWTTDGFTIAPTGLLMSGRTEKATNQFDVTLSLSRNQARFDVWSNVRETHDLVSVQIRNAYPMSSIWNQGVLDYTTATGRIPLYYEIPNTLSSTIGGDGNPLMNNITGGLYVFENQVPMPYNNDRHTTNMIIGLQERGTTAPPTYYRANIAPDESAQMLKRNNVYRLTITNVGGPGQATPELAYDYPDENEMDYVINHWDQGNKGLIVQDGSSILSVPTTTIRIPRTGGVSSYQIFTFTTHTGTVSPLSIGSQNFTPSGGITASLDGNTLVVNAQPLAEGAPPTHGSVMLRFAGLQANINVIQTDDFEDFLILHLPPGGIPRFAPFGGLQSGQIRVEASDDWTAELFMESSQGFTLQQTLPVSGPLVTMITTESGADGYVPNLNNRFVVTTASANSLSEPRAAFLVVTLNKDPENYAQVIRLSQSATGAISIAGNQTTVTFNAMGTALASVPNNLTSTFTVLPTVVDITGLGDYQIMPWYYAIIQQPGSSFDDSPQFEVSNTTVTTDVTNQSGNTITVAVKPPLPNMAGRQYTAVLRIYLDQGNPATDPYVDIRLVQQPATVELSPNILPNILPAGGTTQSVTVQADPSMNWTATVTTVPSTVTATLSSLASGSGLPTVSGVGGQNFTVTFPRLGTPWVTPTATVKVNVEGIETEVIVRQSPVVARNVTFAHAVNNTGATGAGTFYLSNNASGGANGITTLFPAVSGTSAYWSGHAFAGLTYSWTNRGGVGGNIIGTNANNFGSTQAATVFSGTHTLPANAAVTAPNANHQVYSFNSATAAATANNAVAWLNGANNRVLFITLESNQSQFQTLMNGIYGAGHGLVTTGGTGNGINSQTAGSRYTVTGNAGTSALHRYLFQTGPFGNGTDISGSVSLGGYLTNGVAITAASISNVPTLIPIIVYPNGNVGLAIDPVRRVVFVSQASMLGFDYVNSGASANWQTRFPWSNANMIFVRNLSAWVVNVVQWDELFLEDF